MVVYNVTDKPIIIVTKFRVDHRGGPGIPEVTHMIQPGMGIDLSIVGLEVKKPDPKQDDPENYCGAV